MNIKYLYNKVRIRKTVFLEHMIKTFSFKVKCVETDNGTKFTKKLLKENILTLFK